MSVETVEGEQPQTWFFVPIIVAYFAAAGLWMLLPRLRPGLWPARSRLETDRRWLDFALVFVAVAAVLGAGELFRRDLLLPAREGLIGDLFWWLNNLIIYSPLFFILAARRQTTQTVYLTTERLWLKLVVGLVLGGASVAIYTGLRGELTAWPEVLAGSVHRENLRHFLPVFLEGVAVAFAFVRLRWSVGLWPALLIPSALFAAAHIPQQMEGGMAALEMIAYFGTTGLVAFGVLYVLERSRDIVWIGIVHYLMNIAIGAFAVTS